MEKFVLEGCVDSLESASAATCGGANRLELCGNLMIGGTTPTAAVFNGVRRVCRNRVNVLIRPRFGDFCYSDEEFSVIRDEVIQFRKLGADGIVIGILKQDGSLDRQRMAELIEEAGGMSVTLHRAFDVCADPYAALEDAKKLGIDTILTSGQAKVCLEGADCIRELVRKSEGAVDILVGSGVSGSVIEKMYRDTGATSYHMSGKIVKDSNMTYRKQGVPMGLSSVSEYEIWQTDEEKIREAATILQRL